MTLYRQIATGIIVLLVLCFTGTVVLSTNNLRAFLESQMETHAQDTATSLGLSLSPHMLPVDMAIVESMVDAIYDRGYYSTIAITALDGKTLLERRSTVETDRAPAWFIDAIDQAVKLGNPILGNIIMIGALSGTGELSLDREDFREVILERLPEEKLEINLKAFDMGASMVKG